MSAPQANAGEKPSADRLKLAQTLAQKKAPIAKPRNAAGYKHHYGPGLPFQKAFKAEFVTAASSMLPCMGPELNAIREVTFVGIPAHDQHVSEAERKRINDAAIEAIQFSGAQYSANATETVGDLAQIVAEGQAGQKELKTAIDRLYNRPFVTIFKTQRIANDIVRLNVSVFGRTVKKSYECNRPLTLDVRLSDLKVLDGVHATANLFTLEGAYLDALRQSLDHLKTAHRIAFHSKVNALGQCEFKSASGDYPIDYYFKIKADENGPLGSAIDSWPNVDAGDDPYGGLLPQAHDGKGKKEQKIIVGITYRLIPKNYRLIDLKIDIRKGRSLINRHRYKVVLDKWMLDGCRPGAGVARTSLLDILKKQTRKNNMLFSVRATRPSIYIKKDPIKIAVKVNEPLHMFCWYVGPDETAYVVYPRSQKEARTPWKPGLNKHYPTDFGYQAQYFPAPGKILFGCYASRTPLPVDVEQAWIDAHPNHKGGSGPHKELTRAEIQKLAARLLKTGAVGGDYTWLAGVAP